MTNETSPTLFDAVIVGGGAAGLSAAVALGRSRRSVVVLDAGEPRNAPASGVHNFLTRDGTPPAELMQLGRAEVESYGGTIVRGTAVAADRTDAGFAVTTADGAEITGRRGEVGQGHVPPQAQGAQARSDGGEDVFGRIFHAPSMPLTCHCSNKACQFGCSWSSLEP